MIQTIFSKQFLTFLFTGAIAAAVNFSSRILYNCWLSFSLAIIFAYLTGMVTAFILAKLFVFKESQQKISRSAWYFSLVNLAAVAQTWCVSMLLADYLFPLLGITYFAKEFAHGIGVIIPVFTSYVGHKRWSFQ